MTIDKQVIDKTKTIDKQVIDKTKLIQTDRWTNVYCSLVTSLMSFYHQA